MDDAAFVDQAWFTQRQDDFLAFATTELDAASVPNAIAHFERARRDPDFEFDPSSVTTLTFERSFEKIDGWEDTADFDMLYLVNLWAAYGDELDDELRAAIEDRMVGFKHWYTEPTPDGVVDQRWYWSENHRIIYHAVEYLSGQAFPDATFTNDGRSGTEHRDHAAERIDEWVDEKARLGFVEWHSDVYYQKDIVALLTLVEFADDAEIVTKASMLLDLVLFDLALHTLDANNGVTHGRSYMKDKSRAADQSVFGAAKLLFDQTDEPWARPGDPGAALLSRAQRYRMPEVIRRVATSPDEMVDREHMGVPLDPNAPVTDDPEAPYGYDFDDPANVPFWWDRNALTSWQVVPLTLATAEEYGLWESDFFSPYRVIAEIAATDERAAQDLAQTLGHVAAGRLMSEVDTITYRTGDVMLSSAQDYRFGDYGDQFHMWQATLGADAVVFTTHPKEEPETGTQWPDGDGYWNGTGSIPRSAQHGAAAIHVYRPAFVPVETPPLDSFTYLDVTHAYFPTERFDEVTQEGNWTFARKGDGYVGLWSATPASWRAPLDGEFTNGLTEDFDLVAPGAENVWVVQVGDATRSGTFEEFTAALVAATPEVDDALSVRFDSPSEGLMEWGPEGPLTVAGEEVVLHQDRRYDNPWAQAPFRAGVIEISDGDVSLRLDFDTWSRSASAG